MAAAKDSEWLGIAAGVIALVGAAAALAAAPLQRLLIVILYLWWGRELLTRSEVSTEANSVEMSAKTA